MTWSPDEMMAVAAARMLGSDDVCFVGIGAPSAACNLARLTRAPGITLIYESVTISTAPDVLPLSIGDRELCDTALSIVSVPEMFRYWLQGGRVTIRSLGAAQLDPYGNTNTTVVGDYGAPTVRLPGGGGVLEIASSWQQILITMKQTRRGFVPRIDFVTSFGHGTGGDHRARQGIGTKWPTQLITDLAIWTPDPETRAFTVASLHSGVTRAQKADSVGWQVHYADTVSETPPPTADELEVLRALKAPTAADHGGEA